MLHDKQRFSQFDIFKQATINHSTDINVIVWIKIYNPCNTLVQAPPRYHSLLSCKNFFPKNMCHSYFMKNWQSNCKIKQKIYIKPREVNRNQKTKLGINIRNSTEQYFSNWPYCGKLRHCKMFELLTRFKFDCVQLV